MWSRSVLQEVRSAVMFFFIYIFFFINTIFNNNFSISRFSPIFSNLFHPFLSLPFSHFHLCTLFLLCPHLSHPFTHHYLHFYHLLLHHCLFRPFSITTCLLPPILPYLLPLLLYMYCHLSHIYYTAAFSPFSLSPPFSFYLNFHFSAAYIVTLLTLPPPSLPLFLWHLSRPLTPPSPSPVPTPHSRPIQWVCMCPR